MTRPRSVERLIRCFGKLPGIGPKTSERLAYHLLRSDAQEALELARAIEEARRSTRVCSVCFNLDEIDPCSVCADPERDQTTLLVVEDPRDLTAFEESGYRGLYHVLQGRLSSSEGIGPDDLTIAPLIARVKKHKPREICLATNPDLEGEGTARVIAERLEDLGVAVSRLARGLPAGATITQVSKAILVDAVEGRRPLFGGGGGKAGGRGTAGERARAGRGEKSAERPDELPESGRASGPADSPGSVELPSAEVERREPTVDDDANGSGRGSPDREA
jgi:recombination protein RecR